MPEITTTTVSFPSTSSRDALTAILRSGARSYVQQVIGAGGKIDVLVVAHPDADHYNYPKLPDWRQNYPK